MNKYAVLIAVRYGSSRFFGKALEPLGEFTMLSFLVDRIKKSKKIGKIIICTTTSSSDDILIDFCKINNLDFYRGSEDDVLKRICDAVDHFKLDCFIEILGDNPFVHSQIIDDCINIYENNNIEYVSTLTNEYPISSTNKFPIGIRVQIINSNLIKLSLKNTFTKEYREHSSLYISENLDSIKHKFLETNPKYNQCNRPELTFAVNVPNNLKFLNLINNKLKHINNYGLAEIIQCVDDNPNLLNLMGNDA